MELCQRCAAGAVGETGHQLLEFYVAGPYPGQSIFRCGECSESWIRHASLVERYGWTRYFVRYAESRRIPITTGKRGMIPGVA